MSYLAEAEKALKKLEELEEKLESVQRELERIRDEWPKVKSQFDRAYSQILLSEIESEGAKKRPFSQTKEIVRAKALQIRSVSALPELEAKFEFLKKEAQVLKSQIEVLRLKLDFLKSF